MQPIKDRLNKIKWDNRENPEDYTIFYFDRISKKLIKIQFIKIKRTEGNFVIIERDNEEVNIPMHRIREVRKSNEVVWKR